MTHTHSSLKHIHSSFHSSFDFLDRRFKSIARSSSGRPVIDDAFFSSRKKRWLSGLFALISIAIVGCRDADLEATSQRRVSLMAYNVENLFDTLHDPGKDDYTYLPLALKNTPEVRDGCDRMTTERYRQQCLETDWNEAVLEEKLKRVANVIQQVDSGRGPDIQILVEVENTNILEILRTRYLVSSGYQTSVLLEGPDERGIDTAVLSRLPQWDSPRLHLIPFRVEHPADEVSARTTRGILEVRLTLPDGQKLAVFAVHFPSQSNPSYLRRQAAEYLNALIRSPEFPSDAIAIVGGDLNITREEDRMNRYYERILAPHWLISHFVGCQGCKGTHYYGPNDDWSFLDALLFARNRSGDRSRPQWQLDTGSIRLPTGSPYQLNRDGYPSWFDVESSIGVSDHLPVYAAIHLP